MKIITPFIGKIESFSNEYRWLSNFDTVFIPVGKRIFTSVENAYQASKTIVEKEKDLFIDCSAKQAKFLGSPKNKSITFREDFTNEFRLKTMEELVCLKYSLSEYHKEKLIATNGIELIEGNWWGDQFFGVCRGKGENHLGKITMRVRDLLVLQKK